MQAPNEDGSPITYGSIDDIRQNASSNIHNRTIMFKYPGSGLLNLVKSMWPH